MGNGPGQVDEGTESRQPKAVTGKTLNGPLGQSLGQALGKQESKRVSSLQRKPMAVDQGREATRPITVARRVQAG